MPMKLLTGLLVFSTALNSAVTGQKLSSRIEAVRLDVSVKLKDSDIGHLTAEDFAVIDNGRHRPVSLVSTEAMPINVVLLLDTSRSTAGERGRELAAAADALLASLRDQDSAALITFTDLVEGRVPLTRDLARVRDALRKIDSFGRTSVLDAVVGGLSVASSASGRTLLLICSDGVENTSFLSATAVEDLVRGTEAVIYTVVTGNGDSLERLAALSGGASLRATSEEGLSDAFTRIIGDFRKRYILSFSVDPSDSPGWHRVSVRLTKHRGSVRHRQGYWRPPVEVQPAR